MRPGGCRRARDLSACSGRGDAGRVTERFVVAESVLTFVVHAGLPACGLVGRPWYPLFLW